MEKIRVNRYMIVKIRFNKRTLNELKRDFNEKRINYGFAVANPKYDIVIGEQGAQELYNKGTCNGTPVPRPAVYGIYNSYTRSGEKARYIVIHADGSRTWLTDAQRHDMRKGILIYSPEYFEG